MKKDMNDLKSIVFGMIQQNPNSDNLTNLVNNVGLMNNNNTEHLNTVVSAPQNFYHQPQQPQVLPINTPQPNNQFIELNDAVVPESLSIEDKEIELIKKALNKYNGRRKKAAQELGISERTLYRKIKQYDLE
jgi:DNA-binding NtrC family response regulator